MYEHSLDEAPRFRRHGRLSPYPSALEGPQVRCECDRCGAHLLAIEAPTGALEGTCPVCLGRSVSPVPAHLPAA